jgi:malate dehydrogenase (oxaloacetate-decarboxylating)(NADP+)
MSGLILPGRQVFIVDTHVNLDPSAEELAEITQLAADQLCAFGLVPKVGLLSHSNFGSSDAPGAENARHLGAAARAPARIGSGRRNARRLRAGRSVARRVLPDSTLHGSANLLVCPDLDSANIAYNLLKSAAGNNVAIGPILLGCAAPAHILTGAATVRRIVNMTALTVVEATVGAGADSFYFCSLRKAMISARFCASLTWKNILVPGTSALGLVSQRSNRASSHTKPEFLRAAEYA